MTHTPVKDMNVLPQHIYDDWLYSTNGSYIPYEAGLKFAILIKGLKEGRLKFSPDMLRGLPRTSWRNLVIETVLLRKIGREM
jgi:hypothetical protein